MPEFRIELPLPPTANNAYPTNRRTGRRYLSKRAREWKDEAGWLVKLARPCQIRGPYRFQISIPARARGDADGYLKLPMDLLVEFGVTEDDRKAADARSVRDATIPPRRCILAVSELPSPALLSSGG